MRHARRLSLGSIGVAALTLGVILSGCGRTYTTLTGRAAPTSTPTPWPTAAATATTSSAAIPEAAGCPPFSATATQTQYVAVGALDVSIPGRSAGQDYPSVLLPNGLPNAPYQIAASAVTTYAPNPPVNPSLATGYELQVCNRTGAAHTLTGLSVTIASFTPRSGPVNVWHLCGDGPYDAATKHTTTGCGGGIGASDYLAATLPGDSTGATAPAKANGPGGVDLPMSVGPNKAITLLVAVNGLTSQGTYALSFGISVDGAAPASVTPSDGPFLIAPSAVVWTGTACQTPAMQAQIPAASQDTYYVCPPAS
jgi:hypothetical protein